MELKQLLRLAEAKSSSTTPFKVTLTIEGTFNSLDLRPSDIAKIKKQVLTHCKTLAQDEMTHIDFEFNDPDDRQSLEGGATSKTKITASIQ